MALLTQDPAATHPANPMQQDPDAAMEGVEQTEDPNEPQEGLSFTTEQLVDSFKKNMKPEEVKDMGTVIDEGKQLLFGPDTHSQLMGMLEGSKNIGEDLGNGAFDAMNLVLKSVGHNKPREDIEGKAILPAGVALIAMALEFINESGMAPVNDDTFEQATHIFSTRMMSTYDPQFKERAAQYGGSGQATEGQPPEQAQAAPQAGAPVGGM